MKIIKARKLLISLTEDDEVDEDEEDEEDNEDDEETENNCIQLEQFGSEEDQLTSSCHTLLYSTTVR
jgi:hypothetical protein